MEKDKKHRMLYRIRNVIYDFGFCEKEKDLDLLMKAIEMTVNLFQVMILEQE